MFAGMSAISKIYRLCCFPTLPKNWILTFFERGGCSSLRNFLEKNFAFFLFLLSFCWKIFLEKPFPIMIHPFNELSFRIPLLKLILFMCLELFARKFFFLEKSFLSFGILNFSSFPKFLRVSFEILNPPSQNWNSLILEKTDVPKIFLNIYL